MRSSKLIPFLILLLVVAASAGYLAYTVVQTLETEIVIQTKGQEGLTSVMIDSIEVGSTNSVGEFRTTSRYKEGQKVRLSFRHPGLEVVPPETMVVADRARQQIEIQLVSPFVHLDVRTVPVTPNARVGVDGQLMGYTDLQGQWGGKIEKRVGEDLRLSLTDSASRVNGDTDVDVERWLSEFDMEMYAEAFEANALKSRDMLVTLTEDDLASIGVKALGHRKEIMAAIERLKAGPWIPEWSTSYWLKEIGMEEYTANFADNAIATREMVISLAEEDLKSIGVAALGHRKGMVAAISQLKEPREEVKESPTPALPDPGDRPTSPTNDTVVEVHQSHIGTNLWYHVGVVDPNAAVINWGDSQKYDIGQSPMCDFDGHTAVEVHQSHTGTNLWYQVGVVNERSMTIDWGAAQKYDKGRTPIVAVNGDVVVELHQSHTGTNLWYHVGTLNRSARSISWGPSHKFDKGRIPSVGFAEVEQDVIVEVHQSHTGTNLWYHVGTVDPAARTINWGESQRYDKGRLPMCDFDGSHVVEVHQGHNDLNLWCRVGTVDERGQTISWGPSVRYDRGKIPTVALNGNVVIEMHQSHEGTNLWYHVGILNPEMRSISWGASHKYDRGRIPSIGF